MSLAVSAYQEPVLSMLGSPSVICADLSVHQESLDSIQMTHTEGGWVLGTAYIDPLFITLIIAEAVENSDSSSVSCGCEDQELIAEIDCGNEEDGG